MLQIFFDDIATCHYSMNYHKPNYTFLYPCQLEKTIFIQKCIGRKRYFHKTIPLFWLYIMVNETPMSPRANLFIIRSR